MELIWADHLLFVLMGIIVPWRLLQGGQAKVLREMEFDTRLKLGLYYGNSLYLWGLCGIVALLWWLTDRDWSILGLDWPPAQWSATSVAVVSAFVLLYLFDSLSEIISPEKRAATAAHLRENLGFLPANTFEFAHYLVLAFSAGFCEEFVFRGYFVRYFQVLLEPMDPSYTLAILLPAIMFGVAHYYQGGKTVIKVTAMAIMFGFVFVQSGSLWLLILLHFLIDVAGGLIAWRLLDRW